jgi:integrase
MGTRHLTDSTIKRLPTPKRSHALHFDDEVTGLACRVTLAGSKSFVLCYRTNSGRQRRFTIGACSDWPAATARKYARELKKRIRTEDHDPLAALQEGRDAPTVAGMCARFLEEEHGPKLRLSTLEDYRSYIERDILPALRHVKVADVTFADVDGLHRKVSKRAQYVANREASLLSKMFRMAIKWGWRVDTPVMDVQRNPEDKRTRHLAGQELTRLTEALAGLEDQQAAAIVRLLLLTGARSGEVLSMRWDQLDLGAGTWTKPSSHTKQKKEHRVPLSPAALQILSEMRSNDGSSSDHVFPGPGRNHHRESIKKPWARLCKKAGIAGLRVHDLRHTYASILASSGSSLHLIGQMLGHTQPTTTARYAHMLDDPMRAAAERVAGVVAGGPGAKVVELPRRR